VPSVHVTALIEVTDKTLTGTVTQKVVVASQLKTGVLKKKQRARKLNRAPVFVIV